MGTRVEVAVIDDFIERAVFAAFKDMHRRLSMAMPTRWQRLVLADRIKIEYWETDFVAGIAREYLEAPDHGDDETLGIALHAIARHATAYVEQEQADAHARRDNSATCVPATHNRDEDEPVRQGNATADVPATHNCDEDA